jgi:ABC-type nitrate/sulfonate/bicarbonate transport system ATPase subunit
MTAKQPDVMDEFRKLMAGLPQPKAPLVAKSEVKAESPPVVTFKKVTKTYGGKKPSTAIKDVTFTVEDLPDIGEFCTILGPSGCGKSTILKLIAGLEPQFPHTNGEVLVFGKPVNGPGSDRGMVFQEYTAFENRSVRDNVAFGLECRGVPRKERHDKADVWIKNVGLDPAKHGDKYPNQLSGGMRQRVAIARTLILDPKILLMDEPFGALDPMTRLRMQDLLVRLWAKSNNTIFFVTHSIDEAVFLGDRIYIMSPSPGTLVEEIKEKRYAEAALEAKARPDFSERVKYIEAKIAKMEGDKI